MLRRWAAVLLIVACALLAGCMAGGDRGVRVLDRAEAAAAGWDAPAPPASGWTPVELPDTWTRRWPGHDGVVWYRIAWDQQGPAGPVGLLLPYVCLADAVYVNGSLVHRDPQLVEPLSRSWVSPQYFLLDAPLLREGRNEVLVRVSGLSAYQPGLGVAMVGDPAALLGRYRSERFLRHDVQLLSRSTSVVLGALFAMLWLLGRGRGRAMYGWFALSTVFWTIYGWNFVAESPAPFASTDPWSALNIAAFFCGAVSMILFLLRFCGARWPRTERVLLAAGALVLVLAAVAPGYLGPHRGVWALAGAAVYYVALAWFVVHAVRRGTPEQRLLAVCFGLQLLVSLYDLALFFELVAGPTFLLPLTSPLTLLGVGFVLAYRYAQMLGRVEGFNAELRDEVEAATSRLAATLEHEHALALENTRIGERLNLMRDLHDGFGGTLLGAIAALEQPGTPRQPAQVAALLRDMRDDLRLMVDTAVHADGDDVPALLAPLRHRWTQRLDAAGIDARWDLEALDGVRLPAGAGLDAMRLLQEALTNVYRHSGATRVEVAATAALEGRIVVAIHDDGCGIATAAAGSGGMGMGSMKARALRLGAPLQVQAGPDGGTTIAFSLSA